MMEQVTKIIKYCRSQVHILQALNNRKMYLVNNYLCEKSFLKQEKNRKYWFTPEALHHQGLVTCFF